MKIEAVGYTYYHVWGYDKMAQAYLMKTYRIPNKRKKGTKITILNVEEPERLIEQTKSLYLRWRTDYDVLFEDDSGNQILSSFRQDAPGSRRIAVNGSLTQPMKGDESAPPLLFNYNLWADEEEKEKLVDRDRKFTDLDEMRQRAKMIFMRLGKNQSNIIREICEAYSKTKGNYYDLKFNYYNIENYEIWKEIVDEVLRKKTFNANKIAIADNQFKDENLRTLGWTIVDWGYHGNQLLQLCGYKTSGSFDESLGVPRVITWNDLEPGEKHVFEEAKDNLRFLLKNYWGNEDVEYIERLLADDNYDKRDGIAIASSFQGCEEAEDLEGILGMYRGDNKKIYIHRDAIRNGVINATGVLIHEFLHKYYDVRDETREFENKFTDLSGHASHKWATIQTALEQEYQATGDKILIKILPNIEEKETEEKPVGASLSAETVTCWRCENTGTEITPVFKTFPCYDSTTRLFNKCGTGDALEWPYFLKPMCDEGYEAYPPLSK
jgi:hypothetical protein